MTYTEAYSLIMQNIAARLGKERGDLVPWEDYDPIMVDGDAWRILRDQQRLPVWTGD